MRLFHSFDTMDWVRVLWVVSGLTFFWERISSIIPVDFHKTVTTILVALVATIGMMMRSGRSREEIIVEKIIDHHVDGVQKGAEIQNLIANEIQEQGDK